MPVWEDIIQKNMQGKPRSPVTPLNPERNLVESDAPRANQAAAKSVAPASKPAPKAKTAAKPSGESTFNSKSGAMGAAQAAAGGGDAGDIVSSGLIASGNPYAMAAGLALNVLSSGSKAEAAQEQARRQREQQGLTNYATTLQNIAGSYS